MLLVRDGSADRIFHSQAKHILIEEPSIIDQAERVAVTELIDSSSKGTEIKEPTAEIVVRKKMTANCFLPEG